MTDRARDGSAELWQCSAAELARRFAAGLATPPDALEACLAQADRERERLNPIVAEDRAGALAAARASAARWAAGRPLGPLDGVPVTIKDNIPTAGMPATWGSRLYAGFRPEADETPVARLREAGAVVFAKTNVPELTLQGYTSNPLFGTTGNPWNPALTPGGSSGGAVACVAGGIVPVALGTDGGGSIRRPASYGGLVGLKPTTGRVPRRGGLPPILLDFEVIGPIARTVADLVAVMDVIGAADPESVPERGFPPFTASAAVAPSRQRILFAPTFGGAPVDPIIAASVAEAARHLEALGHEVEETASFDLADILNEAWPVFGQAGTAWLLESRGLSAQDLSPALGAVAEAGRAVPASRLFGLMVEVLHLRDRLAQLFRRHDLLLTPSAAALPWAADVTHPQTIAGRPVGPRGAAIFTGFVNAAGCPAISIPCRPAPDGLPVGFQLVGPWGADERLCGVAAAYEAAHPWPFVWESKA